MKEKGLVSQHKSLFCIDNVVIRTFGPKERALMTVEELNDYFQNDHHFSLIKTDKKISKNEIGMIHRDHKGTFLVFNESDRPPNSRVWSQRYFNSKAKFNETKVRSGSFHVTEKQDERKTREFFEQVEEKHREEGFDAIYECFKKYTEEQQCLLIRDDFPWWRANRDDYHCSKPLLISKEDKTIHPIFFDDNILVHSKDPSIIDAKYIETKETIPFNEAIGVYYVCVNTLRAVADDDYFVKMVDLCEANRNILSLDSLNIRK